MMVVWFSHVASALTLVAFLPYLLAIHRGRFRPHVISWVIWFLTTCLVAAGQWADGAGWGAWPILLSGLLSGLVAVFAMRLVRRGQAGTTIRPFDWLCLLLVLVSLPLWWLTQTPTATVILLTTVDLIGFAPTIRRSWRDPWAESMLFVGLFAARNVFVMLALERWTIATSLFPIAITVACVLFIAMALWRRWVLRQPGRQRSVPAIS